MTQKFEKLITLLKELFQLDHPDLDFGLYRIMHAKAGEVTQFLEKDLLPQVKEEFAKYKTADKSELEQQLAKAIEQAAALGADPETLPKVLELRAKLADSAVDLNALEAEVYDHLYSFFRRYYSEGDFLSKRVYKPGVYAIPYEGEEVKLHWANADQYYIKTSEYLRDYAFRLRPEDEANPMRVHFRLVDAVEGEHGNVKAAEGKDRVFILAATDYIAEEAGEQGKELAIRFEYRPATLTDWPEEVRESKKKPPAQKDLVAFAERRILENDDEGLSTWIADLGRPHTKSDGAAADYSRLFAHLSRYVARNTFDYFIHKDLGAFLRRELDFYVKNEVMHLDDIENESAPRVEQYLSKIKVIRRIAAKIITFLAQLEDFQKKLWLKKKFVVETNYCLAIGLIPTDFYEEIATNAAQRQEWVETLSIHEFQKDLTNPGYTEPLTPQFLEAHPSLMIDTRHFAADFTAKLIDCIASLDEAIDGVLFHAENSAALSLMQRRHKEAIRAIYIDPPYNTGSDDFLYKDSYKHSSWLSMICERLSLAASLMQKSGILLANVDDNEFSNLQSALSKVLGADNRIGNLVWKGSTDNNPTRIAVEHEYLVCHAIDKSSVNGEWSTADNDTKQLMLDEFNRLRDSHADFESLKEAFDIFTTENRDALGDLYRYRNVDEEGPYVARRNVENPGKPGYTYDIIHPLTKKPCTKPYWGWRFPPATMDDLLKAGRIIFGSDETKIPELKVYLRDVRFPLRSVIHMDARKGSNDLERLFGARNLFKNPKPVELVLHAIPFILDTNETLLDFFAGSGTTGQALIHLNRTSGKRRNFCLVEMGPHFRSVLLPRLLKVAFTPEWRNGRPARPATQEEVDRGPRAYKYMRLESFEDALNNLQLHRTDAQRSLLSGSTSSEAAVLNEQYMLGYMLDVETSGSQSLLNAQAFFDPTAYNLKVNVAGSDESRDVNVDLLETFNWLIGLTVHHIAAPQCFEAQAERDGENRLRLKDRLKQVDSSDHWFRTVTGTTPDGHNTLIIWRKRPGGEDPKGVEHDNLMLDEWFTRQGYSSKDSEFDLIYVNGTNNLENLRAPDDTWKVRLIEDDFHRLMFATEGI
jgi:adenine-specific DNA-methyltransferase